MIRSALGKVAWVGKTASMVFGLALVLALVIGVATTAIGATGGNFILGKANSATTVSRLTASVAGPALTLVNKSTEAAATALNISVTEGKAPLKVNAAAGTATGLSADELDGMDSDEILPFVRAQKDSNPWGTVTQNTAPVTADTVSVNAPTDGFLVILGSANLTNSSGADQILILRAMLDGTETAGQAAVRLVHGEYEMASYNVTVPVSAGEHMVTSEVYRTVGSGSFTFNRNNLSVMFVPADRGAVTNTAF